MAWAFVVLFEHIKKRFSANSSRVPIFLNPLCHRPICWAWTRAWASASSITTTMLSFFFCLLRERLSGSPSLQTFLSFSFTFKLIATFSHFLFLFLSWLNAHFVHLVHYSRSSLPSFCLFSQLPPLSSLGHLHPPHFFLSSLPPFITGWCFLIF